MKSINVLLVCNGRLALPAMWDAVYNQQLKAVAIPAHCTEFIDEVSQLLYTYVQL